MEKSLLALKQTISHEIANENCQDPDLGSVIGKSMSAWLLCGHVSSQGFNFYPSLCSKLSWGLTFTFRAVIHVVNRKYSLLGSSINCVTWNYYVFLWLNLTLLNTLVYGLWKIPLQNTELFSDTNIFHSNCQWPTTSQIDHFQSHTLQSIWIKGMNRGAKHIIWFNYLFTHQKWKAWSNTSQ